MKWIEIPDVVWMIPQIYQIIWIVAFVPFNLSLSEKTAVAYSVKMASIPEQAPKYDDPLMLPREATVVGNGECLSAVWPGVLMGFESLHGTFIWITECCQYGGILWWPDSLWYCVIM